jgi:uncharacterized protein
MTSHEFDPLQLDVAAFAKDAIQLAGTWSIEQLDRLAASTMNAAAPASDVVWRARGELRTSQHGGKNQVWLHIDAACSLQLECQRCLAAVETRLQVERSFLFVQNEALAAELDADTDDDVLALTRLLNLRELMEDELLLSLPLVPRHEVCPSALPMRAELNDGENDQVNPFAALAVLRRNITTK